MPPISPTRIGYAEAVQVDGRKLDLAIQPVEVDGPGDLERAFATISVDAGTGVAAAADVMFYNERKRITALALASRLPCSIARSLLMLEVCFLTEQMSRRFSDTPPFMWTK